MQDEIRELRIALEHALTAMTEELIGISDHLRDIKEAIEAEKKDPEFVTKLVKSLPKEKEGITNYRRYAKQLYVSGKTSGQIHVLLEKKMRESGHVPGSIPAKLVERWCDECASDENL